MSTTAEAQSVPAIEARPLGAEQRPAPPVEVVVIDRESLRATIKDVFLQVLREQHVLVGDILIQRFEDQALSEAIREGMLTEAISEEEIKKTFAEMEELLGIPG